MKSDCHFQKYTIGIYPSALAFNKKHYTHIKYLFFSYFYVHFPNVHSSINILRNFMRFYKKFSIPLNRPAAKHVLSVQHFSTLYPPLLHPNPCPKISHPNLYPKTAHRMMSSNMAAGCRQTQTC